MLSIYYYFIVSVKFLNIKVSYPVLRTPVMNVKLGYAPVFPFTIILKQIAYPLRNWQIVSTTPRVDTWISNDIVYSDVFVKLYIS